jgi:hypothetical protein
VAHETRVPSRLPDPSCGLQVFRSNPEDPGQLMLVTYHFGRQVAIVADGEDEGEELPVAQMQGEFTCAE